MPTTYHVATTGNNADPGTLAQPWRDPGYAITTATFDDKIRIHKGVYTDVWPFDHVMGRDIAAYEGQDVTIDCQGTRNYVTGSLKINQSGQTLGTIGLYLVGIKFVNYNIAAFGINLLPTNAGSKPFKTSRCFWKAQTNSGTYAHDFLSALGGISDQIWIDNNSFVGHESALIGTSSLQSFINNAFKGNTYSAEPILGVNSEAIGSLNSVAVEKDYNAYPGNSHDAHGINSTSTPFSFNNEGGGDYSLGAASALRGAGKRGGNIGAPFNPLILYDSDLSDLLLSTGVNDEAYYDTNLNTPGVDGPVGAGPATFVSGRWKINNVAEPGATSCQVKIGPKTLPPGSVLRVSGWAAIEDLAPSSGSKQVVDYTVGTSTRDIRLSINGDAKITLTKNTAIDQAASDVTFYMTLRSNGA